MVRAMEVPDVQLAEAHLGSQPNDHNGGGQCQVDLFEG
jgi:hypothetical protein